MPGSFSFRRGVPPRRAIRPTTSSRPSRRRRRRRRLPRRRPRRRLPLSRARRGPVRTNTSRMMAVVSLTHTRRSRMNGMTRRTSRAWQTTGRSTTMGSLMTSEQLDPRQHSLCTTAFSGGCLENRSILVHKRVCHTQCREDTSFRRQNYCKLSEYELLQAPESAPVPCGRAMAGRRQAGAPPAIYMLWLGSTRIWLDTLTCASMAGSFEFVVNDSRIGMM